MTSTYYIQIPEKHATKGFYTLITVGAKSGSIQALPGHIYIINKDHLQLLKRKRIPFKKLRREQLPVQQASTAVS